MSFLKHTFILLTHKRNFSYIHDEKQLYMEYRKYKNSVTYRCKNARCKCSVGIIKHDCFWKNPLERHNQDDTKGEEEFEIIKKRTLLIISLKRLLAENSKRAEFNH